MHAPRYRAGLILVLLSLGSFAGFAQQGLTPEQKAAREAQKAKKTRFRVVLLEFADGNRAAVAADLASRFKGKLEVGEDGGIILETKWGDAISISDDPRVRYVQEIEEKKKQQPLATQISKLGNESNQSLTIQPTVGNQQWSSGQYTYDGAGNIVSIGTPGDPGSDNKIDSYGYDALSRLSSATAHTASANHTQNYTYDAFGNLTSKTTDGAAFSTPAEVLTNRPTAATTATYDAAGNLTSYGGRTFAYDPLGMQTESTRDGENLALSIYTPGEERLGFRNDVSQKWSVTVRDLSGKVLREFKQTNFAPLLEDHFETSTWEKDYIHRGASVLATVDKRGSAVGEMYHLHLDHLGTPRLITKQNGEQDAFLTYFPFGQEVDPVSSITKAERLKFTGHERDFVAGPDEFDYMHARSFNPVIDRFLSVDPVLDLNRAMTHPQAWNRYAYVENNPVNLTDPNGKCPLCVLVAVGVVGGILLNGDVAIAPSSSDELIRNEGPASALGGVMKGLAAWGAGNAATRGIMSLLDRGDPKAVQQSGDRFFKKAPKGSENFRVENKSDGSTKYAYDTPGKVPGSKATYEKLVDKNGNAVSVRKTTMDPKGEVVHVKDKLIEKP